MKKYIYVIALLTATTSTSFAQGLFSISYDIGLPVGNTSDFIGNASFRGFGI